MADQIAETAVQIAPEEPTAVAPEVEPLGDGGKAALEAERKARREADKQLKALQARIQEFEDRDKSEAERLLARAEKAEKDAANLAAAIAKRDIAAKFGITDADDISLFLTGTDEETLTKQAERLAARSTQAPPPAAPSAAGQGNVGKPIGAGDLDQQIADAQKAGNVALSIYLKNQRAEAAR